MNWTFDCLWHRWPWLLLLALLLVLASRILKSPEYIPNTGRKLLFALRATSALCLLLLVFAPSLTFEWEKSVPPVYFVLVDGSASMRIREGGITRAQPVLQLLQEPGWVRQLESKGAQVRTILFGHQAREVQPQQADTSWFSDGLTDLGAAFACIDSLRKNISPHAHVAGAIVFSDGLFNSGPDPAPLAATAGWPLHVVPIGDTTEFPDVYIEKVEAPSSATLHSPLAVRVLVGAKGKVTGTTQVELLLRSKVLTDKDCKLPAGGDLCEIILEPVPKTIGDQKWTVRVRSTIREKVTHNNTKNIWIEVAKSKRKILAVFDRPGLDARFICQAIAKDTTLLLTRRIILRRTDFSKVDKWINQARVDSVDVVLLHQIPFDVFQSRTISLLKNYVSEGHGLIVMGPSNTNPGTVPAWMPYQGPFQRIEPSPSAELSVSRWAQAANIMEVPSSTPIAWNKLIVPPWVRPASHQNIIPLLQVRAGIDAAPLIFWSRLGQGKLLVFLTESNWQWNFASPTQGTARFQDLWPGFVKWMARPEGKKNFHVVLNKREFRVGDNVRVTAELYDKAGRPVPDAEILFEMQKDQHPYLQFLLTRMPDSPGMFQGSVPLLSTGRFQYACKARQHKKIQGIRKGSFTVTGNPLEMSRLAVDRRIMNQLAQRTGGVIYSPQSFRTDIAHNLSYAKIPIRQRKTVRVHTVWPFLLVWIALLVTEWTLRKRWRVE